MCGRDLQHRFVVLLAAAVLAALVPCSAAWAFGPAGGLSGLNRAMSGRMRPTSRLAPAMSAAPRGGPAIIGAAPSRGHGLLTPSRKSPNWSRLKEGVTQKLPSLHHNAGRHGGPAVLPGHYSPLRNHVVPPLPSQHSGRPLITSSIAVADPKANPPVTNQVVPAAPVIPLPPPNNPPPTKQAAPTAPVIPLPPPENSLPTSQAEVLTLPPRNALVSLLSQPKHDLPEAVASVPPPLPYTGGPNPSDADDEGIGWQRERISRFRGVMFSVFVPGRGPA